MVLTAESMITNPSFNRDFCAVLEFHLCRTFRNSRTFGHLWCDGVSHDVQEVELSKKWVNDHREIRTSAWIGKTGQDVRKLRIVLGPKALSKFQRGLALNDVIPASDSANWMSFDEIKNEFELRLL